MSAIGNIVNVTVQGTYVVNPDCTGSPSTVAISDASGEAIAKYQSGDVPRYYGAAANWAPWNRRKRPQL